MVGKEISICFSVCFESIRDFNVGREIRVVKNAKISEQYNRVDGLYYVLFRLSKRSIEGTAANCCLHWP